jgi:hypothetical protein
MTECWRCGRGDTERVEVKLQTEDMPEAKVLEQCLQQMDCIGTRHYDGKPGPALGEEIRKIYQAEYRKHRDCDPPCLDLKQAAEHLIASGVNPAEVGS